LQERRVTPLGSSKAIEVDFNLICATHQQLKQRVLQGQFREDLFYRINGLTLCLPALRERADFAQLCERMLREFSPALAISIAPEVLVAMSTYSWPGNLRQLSHVLRAAVALLDERETIIAWQHLADDLVTEIGSHQLGKLSDNRVLSTPIAAPLETDNLHERSLQVIQQALQKTQGNVSAAARNLGISRQTLYRKLQELR
jgi:transcriptional regulator of acetoin/glycerol metabolism